jgi:hypothetical protein
VGRTHRRSRHPIPASDLANVTVKVIGRFSERSNAIQGKLPERGCRNDRLAMEIGGEKPDGLGAV